ncbi:MAG: glycerophosphodiester phosphodiesterase, partial [Eubacteriales bacterium]
DKDGASDRAELMLCTPYEYKKICRKYEKVCVPELKSNFTLEEIREIMDIFGDHLDRTCFIAFNIANLDHVKTVRPEQTCQFLSGKWDDSYPEMLAARGMGLDIYFPELTAERIQACHAHGIEVNAWTVDNPEDAKRLIAWGIDYITTNILE